MKVTTQEWGIDCKIAPLRMAAELSSTVRPFQMIGMRCKNAYKEDLSLTGLTSSTMPGTRRKTPKKTTEIELIEKGIKAAYNIGL